MQVPYYPGCTLKERALALEQSTHEAAALLDLELVEIEDWTCCGASYPLTTERTANLIPLVRIFNRVKDTGAGALVTTCSFCFNSLRRANFYMENDPIIRRRVNAYLADDKPRRDYDKEPPQPYAEYRGEVRILHLLEVLRDLVSFRNIRRAVDHELPHIVAAPYYGCMLLRPANELLFDDPESPTIMSDFLRACHCGVAEFPLMNECCGSYVSMPHEHEVLAAVHRIIASARSCGANCLVTTCPLCFYNLDRQQEAVAAAYQEFERMPVFYFTQLLGASLGVPLDKLGFDSHAVNPLPLLTQQEVPA